jgi:GNAT superfamily N-acetyltransferase
MLPDGYTDLPPGKLAAVVTYLEMREPPPLPACDPTPFAVRRVTQPDPAWYRDLFRRVGEDWLWFSRLRLYDAELSAILHNRAVDVFALSHEGEDHGLLELDRREFPDIELAFLGVTKPLLGRGAGRILMRHAMEAAWSLNPRRFWVHTCTLDHPDAIKFYVRSGFRPYKRAIEIARDPRLTGDLPRSAAPHVPLL